jgi:Zn-dependent protease
VLVTAGSVTGAFAGLLFITIAFTSVLLHELGHALVARRLGVHVSGIELSFLGGAAKMMQMPRTPDHEIAIAAAGPAVSLMLGGAGLGLGALLHAPLLATIGWINLVLAGFNLIPALPMDGGRILRALLARKMDFVRATDISVYVARVVAVGFVLLGISGWYQLLILAPFLWMMGTRERQLARSATDEYGGMQPWDRWDRWDRGAPGDGERDRGERFHRHGGARFGGAPGPAVRRFTVRQVNGRLVIETTDPTG